MMSSDQVDVAARIRDGECVLGCTLRGVHFATCADYGREPAEATCRGCAPSPVYAGSAICSRCFGRARGLLRDAPDLIGRLRSLSDPMKAMLIEPVKISSRPVEAVAPVGPDLLDAAAMILANLRDWAHALHHEPGLPWHSRTAGLSTLSAFRLASEYSRSIIAQLEVVTADAGRVMDFAEAVLVVHPEIDGERHAWSIADAMYRWGAERPDHQHVHPDVDAEPDREESASPVHEWYEPLLTIKDAATRAGISQRAVQRWISGERLEVVAKVRDPRGVVQSWVRASAVDQVMKETREARERGQIKPSGSDTRSA